MMPPRYFKDCFYFFIGRHLVFTFIFIWVHIKFLNSSWTVMMNCSWTFVLEQFMNCDDELFINFWSWTRKVHFLRTVCELFMNYFWVHNKFLNSSWTDDELFMNVYSFHQNFFVNFSGTIDELFMNYFSFIYSKFMNCGGELFMNFSSWTNNASILWTVHELFMNCSWTVHELFMNCSWTVHEVMNYISPGYIAPAGARTHDLPYTQTSLQARSPTPYSFGHREAVYINNTLTALPQKYVCYIYYI